MAIVGKNEKKIWTDNLYIYEAASSVLDAKIKLVKMEYDRKFRPEGYSEIQKISSRIKSLDSIAGKLEKDGYNFSMESVDDHIHDVVGHRIVCLTLNDLTVFAKLFSESIYNTEAFKLLGYKDFISKPKESGYRSLHLRVGVPVTFSEEHHDVVCEVQLRTTCMDSWAQLEHSVGYKRNKKNANEIQAFIDSLSQQFSMYGSFGDNIDKMASSVLLPSGQVITYDDVIKLIREKVICSNSTEDLKESETGILVKVKK